MQVHSERMIVTNFALHMRAESKESTGAVIHGDLRCFGFKNDASVVHVRIATSLIRSVQYCALNVYFICVLCVVCARFCMCICMYLYVQMFCIQSQSL